MSVTIKTPREIELMREAGRILAKVHNELGKIIKPGITTLEIDRVGEELIRSYGCIPSFLNLCLVGGCLLYNIVLVSAIYHRESATGIYMSPPS